MPTVMRDAEFYKVTFTTLSDDKRQAMLIANASGEIRGCFDIREFFDSWMFQEKREVVVHGIKELSGKAGGFGFMVFDLE